AEPAAIDSSPAMLERARAFAGAGLRFEEGDIATWEPTPFDVVFSNAALHWLPDHRRLLVRLTSAVPAGGQISVQVPANGDHPSHTVGLAIAGEAPLAEAFPGDPPPDPATPALAPQGHAGLLRAAG